MHYQEPVETTKPHKQAYLDGLEGLIEILQTRAAETRRDYCRNITADPEAYRRDLRALLGWPLTDPAPAAPPRVTARELSREAGYTLSRLQIEVLPGVRLSGLLFRLDGDTPRPLVLAQHGKMGTPERISGVYGGTSNYNQMVSRMLARDVHIFAPQLCLWGDSYQVPFDRIALDARLKRLGSSVAAVEIYGLLRVLDHFVAQPYVSCLGMAGMSYGGFYTLMTAALDTRLRSALCCPYFNKRDAAPWSDWVWFGSGLKFDDSQLACLVYPRKFYVLMGEQDPLFDYRETLAACREAEAMAPGDWLQTHIFDGAHEFCKDEEPLADFLRQLKEIPE